MDSVYAIFDLFHESTWIQNLYKYGYVEMTQVYDRKHIPAIIMELYESSWSDELEFLRPDVEHAGLTFMTIDEMRHVYIAEVLNVLQDVVCDDVAKQIVRNMISC